MTDPPDRVVAVPLHLTVAFQDSCARQRTDRACGTEQYAEVWVVESRRFGGDTSKDRRDDGSKQHRSESHLFERFEHYQPLPGRNRSPRLHLATAS